MAIPGRTLDQYEVRGKLRNGIKVNGKPRSVDHFVGDDDEYAALIYDEAGPQPLSKLSVTFPYATAVENFGTGLEWWRGKQLTCYTKESGTNPVALRVTSMLDKDDVKRGDERGNQRTPISCLADACPHFGNKSGRPECKPMGRLVFFLTGGRQDAVLQIDTKGWNSIENLSKALITAERQGDLRGRKFILAVAFTKTAAGRFPVLTLTEENPVPITDTTVALADLAMQGYAAIEKEDEAAQRVVLAGLLDEIRPGWRGQDEYVAKIKEVGVLKALTGTLDRIQPSLA